MPATPTADAVVIERTLDAPPDLVWRMWTEPEHFAAWYGPQGASVPVAELDVRPGGRRRLCIEMQMGDEAMTMWFAGEFTEVVEHRRLVYTDSMADEQGNVLPSPAPGHPDVTEVTVELRPDGDGTRLVLTHAGVPADSPGAQGWQQALDALATALADQTI